MNSQDGQEKSPWSTFSKLDEQELLELLDTQNIRALKQEQERVTLPDTLPPISERKGEEKVTPKVPPPPSAALLAPRQEGLPQDGLPHLNAYSATPRYDLEAAVAESGVPAMTLRAWERRYGIPSPWSGGNNYKLYSLRDLMAVRWVRKRISMGASVRQAMMELARFEPEYAFSRGESSSILSVLPPKQDLTLMRDPLMRAYTLMDEIGAERILSDAFATHPVGFVCQQLLQPVLIQIIELRKQSNLPLAVEMFAAKVTRAQVVHLIEAGLPPREALQRLSSLTLQAPQAYESLQRERQQRTSKAPELLHLEDPLLDCIRRLDEVGAQRLLDEAFFYYSVEDVCMNLLQMVLYRVGTLWEQQKISVTIEHFASNLIRTRLSHLFQSTPNLRQGPAILVGCAPKETHEIGVLMLALFWRRAGLHVYYLGQMLEVQSLMQEIRTMKPGLVCLSATTRPRVKDLVEVAREIAKMSQPKPIFCFGGGAFSRDESLIRSVKGVYLGNDAYMATQRIKELTRLQSMFSNEDIENNILRK